MPDRYIYDVALYWLEEDTFSEKYDTALSDFLEEYEHSTGSPLTRDRKMSLTDGFWKRYIAPWRFNQIIGWIRICLIGSQIRGELWLVGAKQSRRNMARKHFSAIGEAFQIQIWPDSTSTDVSNELLSELRSFKKIGMRSVYPDLEAFENLSPTIDWIGLMRSDG